MTERKPFQLGGIRVPPGERKDIRIKISELYVATPVFIPCTVLHGVHDGPTVFVTAVLHGDELNGLEIIRQVRVSVNPRLLRGTLILVGIANPIGFMLQQRDLPDGRDLNRSFPGRRTGSIASYMAREIFTKIVSKADFGIDLHTAGHGRINLPHIRGDLTNPRVRELAFAFGAEIIFDMAGENGTLRREACTRGIATITFEAGEPMKFENQVIVRGLLGLRNTLQGLGMYSFPRRPPAFQLIVDEHKWVRAPKGGILIMHVKPGDVVRKGQILAHSSKPFGTEAVNIRAPYSGVVISTTTIPAVLPGSAVCHISKLDGHKLETIGKLINKNNLRVE